MDSKLKGILLAVRLLRDMAERDKECEVTLSRAADIIEREAMIAYGDKGDNMKRMDYNEFPSDESTRGGV